MPTKYKDHSLSGNYEKYRECHITPDWLLVYKIENDTLTLILFRTGSHSDYCPDVPGCVAVGDTIEEARKEFLTALKIHFESLKEDGLPIPVPTSSFAFTSEDCSGVLNVRTKKSTHLKLIKLAEKENVSVSHLVNDAIIKQYG